MEPLIELQAEKTVVVLGPLFAASLLKEESRQPPLEYYSLKTHVLQAARQVSGGRKLKEMSGTVLQDALQVLQKCDRLEKWLSHTFTGHKTVVTPLLEALLELQRKGALLMSLHFDDVCEQASDLTSFTLSQVTEWASGGCGILHPFGVHTEMDSMKKFISHGLTLLTTMPEGFSTVLHERMFVFLGFDTEDDYFRSLMDITSTHCIQKPLHVLPRGSCTSAAFPSLVIPVRDVLAADVLSQAGEFAKQIGHLIEFPPVCDAKDSIAFIFSTKSNSKDVIRIVSGLPGAGFALMSNFQHGDSNTMYSISLQVSSEAVFRFWNSLLAENVVDELMGASVLALALPNGTCIWLNGTRKLTGTDVDTKPSIAALVNGERTPWLNFKQERKSPSPLAFSGGNKTHGTSRMIPRFTVTKHKSTAPHAKKHFSDTGSGPNVPSSILRRRLSLPPHLVVPPAHTGNVRPSPNSSVSLRHQVLLGRYVFKRKLCSSDAKIVKDILKEELKESKTSRHKINIYSTKVDDSIFERRRNLFIDMNREWSNGLHPILERKVARWHRLKQKRLQAKLEKEEAEKRVRKSSLDSTSSEGTVKQLLAPSFAPGGVPVQTVTGLPYVIPQTNGLSVMYSPTPYLQYPFVTAVPMNRTFPYISQFASPNVVFIPNGTSPATSVCPTTATTLLRPQNGSVSPPTVALPLASTSPMSPAMMSTINGVKIAQKKPHEQQQNGSISPPSITLPLANTSPMSPAIMTTINGVKPGQKRPREQQQFSFNNVSTSNISTLLQSDIPALKQARMSPAGERSDGEESNSDRCSPQSPESGQLKLWQFILELLLSQTHSHIIEWNFGSPMEFKIKEPRLLAELWSGIRKNITDPSKLKRALYYYSTRSPPILSPVDGKEWSFKFTNSVSWYIHSRSFQLQKEVGLRKMTDDISGSREVLVVD